MEFDIQPVLENEQVVLSPLRAEDFEALYAVAADPEIWAQHPNRDRWKKEVFATFFEGAMESKGAFKITDKINGHVIGSTRFYDYDEVQKSILIGYTFFATKYWGTGVNHIVKKLMLDYIFQFVPAVYFHIGAVNIRSQISISRLGATKIGEQQVNYFGEGSNLNYVYLLEKSSHSIQNEG